ncbi:MAG: His/Gly/Thr/Pro-type tRNA ligase C-terminal domain-containing protein, partial [Planctomycetota bacterium]
GLWDKTEVPYLFDLSVEGMSNFLCGANRKDAHYLGVVPARDLPQIDDFRDLSVAVEGQLCSHCTVGRYEEKQGIELGHVFQLQQVYSLPMEATYADAAGEHTAFWMGCYGIGVSRIVQATVEQHHDGRGIIWPWSLAPFQVAVVPANAARHLAAAEEIYQGFEEAGLRVLLDDRPARIGEKLTDAELLGWPAQVVVGRSWESDRKVELRWRDLRNWDAKVFENPKPGSLPTAVVELEEAVRFLKEIAEWTSD